jgi:plastocyanin
LLAVVVLGLGARHDESVSATPTTRTIVVKDNYFQPPILHVMPGDTVRWVNEGQHSHTVTTQDGRDYTLARGTSVAFTFHTDGRLRYYCRFHPVHRMEGVIVVGIGLQTETSAMARFDVVEGTSTTATEPCCEGGR